LFELEFREPLVIVFRFFSPFSRFLDQGRSNDAFVRIQPGEARILSKSGAFIFVSFWVREKDVFSGPILEYFRLPRSGGSDVFSLSRASSVVQLVNTDAATSLCALYWVSLMLAFFGGELRVFEWVWYWRRFAQAWRDKLGGSCVSACDCLYLFSL